MADDDFSVVSIENEKDSTEDFLTTEEAESIPVDKPLKSRSRRKQKMPQDLPLRRWQYVPQIEENLDRNDVQLQLMIHTHMEVSTKFLKNPIQQVHRF